MEIRQKNIHDSEVIWRIDEEVGHAFLGNDFSIRAARRFQGAHRSCSNRGDPARVVDLSCGFGRNVEALRMHSMLGDVV